MIVIGVDGSDAAKEALQYGLHEASIRGTRVRAVHAWMHSSAIPATGPGMLPAVDASPMRAAAEDLLRTTVEAVAGDAADRIDRVVVESPAGPGSSPTPVTPSSSSSAAAGSEPCGRSCSDP